MPQQHQHDVLIIGSGASGLSLALQLANHARIAVLSKGPLTEGATFYAQGGVSAVLDIRDSIESHVSDTLAAGAGLCNEEVVRFVVEQGPESIQWLIRQGVDFTRARATNGQTDYHLNREGGHSHRRIIHAADATGRAIETTLENRVRTHPDIELFEHYTAVDLITAARLGRATEDGNDRCLGAYVYNQKTGQTEVFAARFVVIAAGGAGKVYLYTSNPDVSTGDGIAMAWRAGCRVANMEFVQFHPTCLFHPKAKSYLITEALRGEGAILRLPDGEPFMQRFDDRAELAPRDIVARAIDHEMKRLGLDCVYLDITHKSAEFIHEHFPSIHATCLKYGIDMTAEPIPVVPAAHYLCGGVIVDRRGCTDLPGLYAIGEASCTGLHGANRMASNSLLECVVYAHAAYKDITTAMATAALPAGLPDWDESLVTDSDEEVVVSHNWDEIRRFMWDYVGIVRTTKRLQRARHRIELLRKEIHEYYGNFRLTNDLIELRNICTVADMIIRCALARRESRGLHFINDYPFTDDSQPPQDTILKPPRRVSAKMSRNTA
ncbi:MAG: L-aspartate oxidase [Gammaproteobacteria bacterium]|nr:L-aspartate oxidase [Gammaproteobacteria bacterium]